MSQVVSFLFYKRILSQPNLNLPYLTSPNLHSKSEIVMKHIPVREGLIFVTFVASMIWGLLFQIRYYTLSFEVEKHEEKTDSIHQRKISRKSMETSSKKCWEIQKYKTKNWSVTTNEHKVSPKKIHLFRIRKIYHWL